MECKWKAHTWWWNGAQTNFRSHDLLARMLLHHHIVTLIAVRTMNKECRTSGQGRKPARIGARKEFKSRKWKNNSGEIQCHVVFIFVYVCHCTTRLIIMSKSPLCKWLCSICLLPSSDYFCLLFLRMGNSPRPCALSPVDDTGGGIGSSGDALVPNCNFCCLLLFTTLPGKGWNKNKKENVSQVIARWRSICVTDTSSLSIEGKQEKESIQDGHFLVQKYDCGKVMYLLDTCTEKHSSFSVTWFVGTEFMSQNRL